METKGCQPLENCKKKEMFCEREIEEVQIPVPYGFISGVWWGSKDRRPVLAIHGWQDNAGTWERLMPLLSPDISVLAIDLPGHGHSSHYPPGQIYYLFWDGVYLIRRIVKYFNWKKVTIMGHSLGGAIGFLYAGIYPEEIDKLIQIDIVNPTIQETKTEASKCSECIDKLLKYETLSEESMPCYDYEEMLSLVEDAYKGSVSRDSCEVLMKRGMAPSPKGSGYYFVRDVRLKVGVAGLGFVSLDLILEFAQRIKCNVLNIKAKPGMSFEKPHYYNMVLDKMRKNAHVEYYEVNGTHHVHLNNPERISCIVDNFILQPVIPNCATQDDVDDDDGMYPV